MSKVAEKCGEYAMKYVVDIVITGLILMARNVVDGHLRKATTKATEDVIKDGRRLKNFIREKRSQAI